MKSVFLCVNSVSPTCNFRSNWIFSVPPKHTTRCHRLRNRKNSLPLVLYFFWSSSTQWILSSTSITVLSIALCWVSRTKPIRRISESPSWKLMSKGEREITSNLITYKGESIKGEKEISRGREYSRILDAWCSRGEMSHAFLGERHVFALSSIHLYLSALIFCSLSSPNIPCKILGEQDT